MRLNLPKIEIEKTAYPHGVEIAANRRVNNLITIIE